MVFVVFEFYIDMNKQDEIQVIREQVDKICRATGKDKDKVLAYQHKIMQLLLQEKTTRVMNDQLSRQI